MRGHHRLRGSLALVTAALCLAFVVELSPHLVHHLVDAADGRSECPFATTADRQQGDVPAVVVVLPAEGERVTMAPAPVLAVPSRPTTPAEARAPPLTTV